MAIFAECGSLVNPLCVLVKRRFPHLELESRHRRMDIGLNLPDSKDAILKDGATKTTVSRVRDVASTVFHVFQRLRLRVLCASLLPTRGSRITLF